MNTTRLNNRLKKIERGLFPPDDGMFTLEELCRAMWQENKTYFLKQAAILALLSQRNIEEAARLAGVGARTLHRWMKEPEFAAAYRQAKRVAYSQAIARVRAAQSILDHTANAIEIEGIEARLTELEQAADQSKSPQG